jgi:hypothetical protein
MFKTQWFDRSLIRSDSGFSLRWGQDWATYEEGGRKLTLTLDIGGSGATVFLGSITRWDDAPTQVIDETTQNRIAENVRDALVWKGLNVDIFP